MKAEKKKIPDEKCAGICGLFCGTCLYFRDDCDGCLSDRVRGSCIECRHGFRTCSKEHGVTRCYECGEFPCGRLDDFSKIHIENGICHHTNVVPDLRRMGEVGVRAWVEEQTAAHTCRDCGELILWYEAKTHACRK